MKNYKTTPLIKSSLKGKKPPKKGKGIRLAIYQGGGLVGNKKAIKHNLNNLKKWAKMASNHRAQIIVLPELFLSGYNIRLSDRDNVTLTQSQVLKKISPIAKKNKIAIVCPYPEVIETSQEKKYYDSMVLVNKSGKLLKNYRKTHLWGIGEKKNWNFGYVENPEEAYEVKKVNGVNIGLLNCYEAEFPELSSDIGTCNDHGVWQKWAYPDISKTAIPGSAYQNGIFVAYANHSLFEFRADDNSLSGVYLGNSTIANPNGEIMVSAENVETLLLADCCLDDAYPTHPFGESAYIEDRRPELYEQLTKMKIKKANGDEFCYPKNPDKYYHDK
jgi:predicted amidohydrolase